MDNKFSPNWLHGCIMILTPKDNILRLTLDLTNSKYLLNIILLLKVFNINLLNRLVNKILYLVLESFQKSIKLFMKVNSLLKQNQIISLFIWILRKKFLLIALLISVILLYTNYLLILLKKYGISFLKRIKKEWSTQVTNGCKRLSRPFKNDPYINNQYAYQLLILTIIYHVWPIFRKRILVLSIRLRGSWTFR